jgi:hypothetical protein
MIKTYLAIDMNYELQHSNTRIGIPGSSARPTELPEYTKQLTHLQNCSHENGNHNIHLSKKTRRISHMKNLS